MPATDRDEALPRVVSMRDLLASCAAASVISTPPRVPDPGTSLPPVPVDRRGKDHGGAGHREAA